MKIKSVDLQKTVLDLLENYGNTADIIVRDTCIEVGNETAEVIKKHIDFGTGSYKENIICEELDIGSKKRKTTVGVHAGNEYWRLSHLLEHGHQIISHGKNKGTTEPRPHFRYGEEYADKELPKRFIEKANK